MPSYSRLLSGLLPTPGCLGWGSPVGDGGEPWPRAVLRAGPWSGSRDAVGFVRTRASQQRPPPGRAQTFGAATSGRQKAGGGPGERLQGAGRLELPGWCRGRSGRGNQRKNGAGAGGGNRADEGELPPRKEADPFGGRCTVPGRGQGVCPPARCWPGSSPPRGAPSRPLRGAARKEPGPFRGGQVHRAPRRRAHRPCR